MLFLGKLYRFFHALRQVEAVWQIGERIMVSKVCNSLLSSTVLDAYSQVDNYIGEIVRQGFLFGEIKSPSSP